MNSFKLTAAAVAMIAFLLLVSPGWTLAQTVIFDEAHGQRFLAESEGDLDLSKLAELFRSEGLGVVTSGQALSDKGLAQADALVISGPFKALTQAEISTVASFVERGGRLAVMLHIGPPVVDLLHSLNVSVYSGVVREQQNRIDRDTNYYITDLKPHRLFKGLNSFGVYGGWALVSRHDNATVIARTSPQAWMDMNGNNQQDQNEPGKAFGLVVAGKLGDGEYVVFGDDAIFQNRFLKNENLTLAGNLAVWLKGE